MTHRLLLDQGVVGTAISYHDDWQRRQADVNHKVLVVARLGADLQQSEKRERVSFPGLAENENVKICIRIQLKFYTTMLKKRQKCIIVR